MSSTETEPTGDLVVAIPVTEGQLCMHFGHCQQFALLDVNTAKKEILSIRHLTPPPHEPGLLPRWLHEQGVRVVIAGGMGRRAQDIFAERNIRVLVGVPPGEPENIVRNYLDDKLQSGKNLCDH